MANITALQFTAVTNDGEPIYPPANIVRGATPLTVSITAGQGLAAVVVCTDTDCRMTTDSAAPLAYDIPILSAIGNQFTLSPGAVVTLKFA